MLFIARAPIDFYDVVIPVLGIIRDVMAYPKYRTGCSKEWIY